MPALRTSARRSDMRWARWIGSGMSTSVSFAGVAEHHPLVAGALLVELSSSPAVPERTSSESSTPWAMSADCSSRATMTPQVLPS